MNILNQIQDHGINISISGDTMILQPVEKVTPEIAAIAKANKTEIIQELKGRKPCWCLSCKHYCYKRLDDGVEALFCNQKQEAVYYLARCPLGFWVKSDRGRAGVMPCPCKKQGI